MTDTSNKSQSFYSSSGSTDGIRKYGYPTPGLQDLTPRLAMGTDPNSDISIFGKDYDYVVIGSGFMALAFIKKAFQINPYSKILCLERGDFWLSSHFQNLPLPFHVVNRGFSETFPWTLSKQTYEGSGVPALKSNYLHGSSPFFGGRSTLWAAWSPQPRKEDLRLFPPSMIETASKEEFWTEARKLLNVVPANEIGSDIFGPLQDQVSKRLHNLHKNKRDAFTYYESASLAVGPNSQKSSLKFAKYSVPGPLLAISEEQRDLNKKGEGGPLEIVTGYIVKLLGTHDNDKDLEKDKYVSLIETTCSTNNITLTGNNTKIILCAGGIPNTTLVLNSFNSPHIQKTAGKRLTGHFRTHVKARCSKDTFTGLRGLQLGAHYVAGRDKDKKLQYHIQLTSVYCPDPENEQEDLARESPDFGSAPSMDQLIGSKNKVIFTCATLGEIMESKDCYMELNEIEGDKPTHNVNVHFNYSDDDKVLWDAMDEATYEAIDALAKGSLVEYWYNDKWNPQRPDESAIRKAGIVHESSTLFMGTKEEGGSVDENYRLYGTKNVYVTGAALFPTAGSWNPTLTMCGYAQDLARRIVKPHQVESIA